MCSRSSFGSGSDDAEPVGGAHVGSSSSDITSSACHVAVGIGAVGAAIVGIVRDGDTATPAWLGCLGMLVVGVIGLEVTGTP